MGKATLYVLLKRACSYIGWRLFLWGSGMDQETYWTAVYNQEATRRGEGFGEKNE